MMSLGSPRRSKASPALSSRTDRDAYGTFGDDDDRAFASSAKRPMRVPRPSSGRSRSSHTALLRAVGIGALFLLAAGYMVSQYHHAASPSPAASETSASSHLLREQKTHASRASVKQASDVETVFVNGIDPAKLKDHLHAYASKPHSAGTQQDYQTAVYTKEQFEKFGIQAEIVPYYTLLSVPLRRRVAITGPSQAARELDLNEKTVESDLCTTDEDALPPFLAYTATGNVTASIVYVNYGRLEDFQWLVDNGIELKGKIALARYGQIFRGLKVMLAEQHGMVGTLIYSDPQDDGFSQGAVYPEGPWRPSGSFQRGSSQYLSLYAGDPLTPGFPSLKDAPYLSIEEAKNIPHIPATVLSYEQAIFILQSLGGKPAPAKWQGGLTLTNGYSLGDDGATKVNVDVEMENKIGPIWDVVGTIEGAEEPDEIVLIGNHRDAWVCGAIDPSSGSATLLEIARGYGNLLKNGWKPRRTIKLASWDGEEYGLLGSTEYAEDNAKELLEKAVAYINVDAVAGPYVSAAGTPSIAEFLFETAKSVPSNKFFGNETEETLYEQWVAHSTAERKLNPAIEKGTLAPDHLISFLGSGTDFTAFYQHLGIISANLAFGMGNAPYGTYHSTMDSPMFLEKFADPHYTTQATTAKWWGLLAIRLATEPIVPFDFSTYGVVMHTDLSNLEVQTKALKLDIDYSALRESIDHFIANAELFRARAIDFKAALAAGKASDADAKKLNKKLVRLERQFISEHGLQHRPWFRHVIFGPGFYEGYAGAAFPGISDGIKFKDNAETIQAHVTVVAGIVKGAAEFLVSQ
jgi:N-acetylated-alpha-linked acidic dipeptidase